MCMNQLVNLGAARIGKVIRRVGTDQPALEAEVELLRTRREEGTDRAGQGSTDLSTENRLAR